MKTKSNLRVSKAGRKKVPQIDRFKAQVWYWVVKHHSKLTDYKLDMLFGQANGPMKSGGESRTRVFGAIKNKGVVPTRGDNSKRKFDLIKRVGEVYPQTIESFDSLIWELFDLEPYDLQATNQFLIKCFKKFEVTLLKGRPAGVWGQYAHHKQESGFEDYFWNRRKMSIFEMSLINTMDSIPKNLDSLALIGALYRKYHLEFNHPRVEKIKNIFNRHLAHVLDLPEMEMCAATFHALAVMIILCGRKGSFPTRKDRSRYGDEELAQLHSSEGLLVCNKNPTYRFYRKNQKDVAIKMAKKWDFSHE